MQAKADRSQVLESDIFVQSFSRACSTHSHGYIELTSEDQGRSDIERICRRKKRTKQKEKKECQRR